MNIAQQTNFLQCFICLQKVRKARMCSHCSKLACTDCIRNWLENRRAECPHCRRPASLNTFADCERFIDELMGVFRKIDKGERTRQKCREHEMQMQYYCNNCRVAICSDCGMFTENHKGHNITKLVRIYEQNKNRIMSDMTKFDAKIQEYRKNGSAMKLQLQRLVMILQQKKTYLEAYMGNLMEKLELEFKEKQAYILTKFQTNQEQIQMLNGFRQSILSNLQNYSQNQVIEKAAETLQMIDALCQRQVQEIEVDSYFTTIHELVPQYKKFEYILSDFSKLPAGVHYSPSYLHLGVQWRLKIYPKGNGIAKEKCLSVFLQMTTGYESAVKYEYKIQLVNFTSEADSVVREYSSEFYIGECWGYNQFIELDALTEDFRQGDKLEFRFYVRNPTYKALCADQQKYVEKLQLKVKELQKVLVEKHSSSASLIGAASSLSPRLTGRHSLGVPSSSREDPEGMQPERGGREDRKAITMSEIRKKPIKNELISHDIEIESVISSLHEEYESS